MFSYIFLLIFCLLGSVDAYVKYLFNHAANRRTDFGRLPNKPQFDDQALEKIQKTIDENILQPFL